MHTLANVARSRISGMKERPIIGQAHGQTVESLTSIAYAIASADPEKELPIGVLMNLDPEGYLLLVAAVASGRPLIPLDAAAPFDQLLARTRAAGASAIISTDELRDLAHRFDLPIVEPTSDFDEACLIQSGGDDPCFICFTSGSTGEPVPFFKTHRGMYELGVVRRDAFETVEDERALICISPLFVGMLNRVAQQLVSGGDVIAMNLKQSGEGGLLAALETYKVHVVGLVPTMLRSVIRSAGGTRFPSSLRSVIVSGEKFTRADLRFWREALHDDTRIFTSYGSTESGTLAVREIGSDDMVGDDLVPAGVPLPGVDFLIVDEDGVEAPMGKEGWLHVRSPYQSFSNDKSSSSMLVAIQGHGEGWFRMGDIGRIGVDGELSVIGRADGEEKVGGIRFNPAAFESAFRSVESVQEPVVVMVQRERARVPVAFVQGDSGILEELRRVARATGPAGEQIQFVFKEEMPTTASGKADRTRLIKEGSTRFLVKNRRERTQYTRTESAIADAWSKQLGMQAPPKNVPFNDLGGDSLGMLSVVIRLKEKVGITISMQELGELNTIERQAEAATIDEVASTALNQLAPATTHRETMVIFPGVGGHGWTFEPLARSLEVDVEIAAADWSGRFDLGMLAKEIALWNDGRKLTLMGFSAGTQIGTAIAQELDHRDDPPARFIALDGWGSPSLWYRIRAMRRMGREGARAETGVEAHLQRTSIAGYEVLIGLPKVRIDIPIDLILSSGQNVRARTVNWEKISRGPITVQTLAFDHLSLVRSPVPSEVLDSIRAILSG